MDRPQNSQHIFRYAYWAIPSPLRDLLSIPNTDVKCQNTRGTANFAFRILCFSDQDTQHSQANNSDRHKLIPLNHAASNMLDHTPELPECLDIKSMLYLLTIQISCLIFTAICMIYTIKNRRRLQREHEEARLRAARLHEAINRLHHLCLQFDYESRHPQVADAHSTTREAAPSIL